MAIPARRSLPFLAGIVVVILFLESRYVLKAMGEVDAMDDSAALINASSLGANWDARSKHRKNMDVNVNVNCCYDNHIGRCIPGTADVSYCNHLCGKSHCHRGGTCKIRGKKAPNHFCHCFC